MEKVRIFLFAFLAFCVFSSKNIIIYNEETLVALSFVSFIFFVSHYFGKTIAESLDERSDALKVEFQNLSRERRDSLSTLLKEYQKLLNFQNPLESVNQFTVHRFLAKVTASGGEGETTKALQSLFSSQIEQKLKTLSRSKLNLQQQLQQLLANHVLNNVHVFFQRSKKQKKFQQFDRQLIANALNLLSTKK